MEVILKIFFERFESLERNCLHARYHRKDMVDYFNTLIEGCRLGQNCDVQKVIREAVICILRYHNNAKLQNGNVCIMGKYHNVLYVALKICYDWQLKDTGTVAALLDSIYSCEKTFERLMVGAIFGTRAPHFIAGWKSDFENQEENLRAVVYYLDHATNASLEYSYGTENYSIRFIDVPIECCGKATVLKIIAHLGLPDKMHIFLRFGAMVVPEFDQSETIVDILLEKLSEHKKQYPYNIVACLQLVLRVLPCLPVTSKEYKEGSNIPRDFTLDKYDFLVEDAIMPMNRCGIIPTNLKHLCRCKVRETLWKNFQLPNGIRLLPVPESLQRYVDIMED